MKSLLIKDFILMKKKIKLIIIGALVMILIFYFNGAAHDLTGASGFIIGYMSFLGMLISLRTISNDQADNTKSFFFTLPFSRKTYVFEKYIFCFLIGLICFGFSFLIVLGMKFFKPDMNLVEIIYTAGCIFPIMVILIDIMIPVEFKFGKYISQFILVALIVFIVFLCLVFGYYVLTYGVHNPFLVNMTYEQLILYLYLIALLVTLISILISLIIIKHLDY